MRRLLPAYLLLSLTLPFPALADDVMAESTLRTVTVYADRAELTRRATVDVPAGAHTIVFSGLPADLMPDSLRADGKAAASVTFGAVSYKQVMESELAAPREKELSDRLQELQDQQRAIAAERQALETKRIFLSNIGQTATLRANEDIAEINLKPDQWSAASDMLYTGMSAVLKDNLAQDIKAREIAKEIAKISAELNQLRTDQRSTWQISLPVESSAATRMTVDLIYQISNATWQPIYDARLDTKSGKLDLIEYGQVSQQTGEDWKDVELTLSTAQPQRGTDLPDLTPQWVNIWKNDGRGVAAFAGAAVQNTAMRMKSEMAADIAMPAAAPMEMAEQKDAAFRTATIETGGFVSAYKIPGPSTVTADGTESKLMIGPFETESTLQIQLKPQFSTDAFLVARAKLKGESPVLPGQVSLFRDGAYIGQTTIPLLRPGEEQNLSFGVDDQVSMQCRTMKDQKSEAGIISRDQVLERQFIREIRNLHTQAVDVVVLETVPAPQDDKIRVEILPDATTPGYETDADNIKGQLRWKIKLDPKAEKDLKLGWKVSWPADYQMSGL